MRKVGEMNDKKSCIK